MNDNANSTFDWERHYRGLSNFYLAAFVSTIIGILFFMGLILWGPTEEEVRVRNADTPPQQSKQEKNMPDQAFNPCNHSASCYHGEN